MGTLHGLTCARVAIDVYERRVRVRLVVLKKGYVRRMNAVAGVGGLHEAAAVVASGIAVVTADMPVMIAPF